MNRSDGLESIDILLILEINPLHHVADASGIKATNISLEVAKSWQQRPESIEQRAE